MSAPTIWRCVRSTALALVVLAAFPRAVLATSGTVITTTGKGLSLTVDTRWVNGAGFRPVWIDVIPTVANAADRTLTIEFRARSMYGGNQDLLVSQDIELPAGSTGVTSVLSVPQHIPWTQYELSVYEDGRFSKTLSQLSIGLPIWSHGNEALPNILCITAAAPPAATGPAPAAVGVAVASEDTSALAELLPADSNQGYYAPASVQTGAPVQLNTQIGLAVDRLPTKWIDYSQLDIICISRPALVELVDHPKRLKALGDWVAAGGNLFVEGLGDDFAGLSEVEKAFELPGLETPAGGDAMHRGWSLPPQSADQGLVENPFGRSETIVQPTEVVQVGPDGVPVTVPAAAPVQAEPPGDPAHPPFVYRPLGMGVVVGISKDSAFSLSTRQWAWVLNTLSPDRWLWYRRHGVSMQRENIGFWNWLVPGVGMAPVTEFRLLITLFVVCIGPLNYFWLKRRGQLHLLVLVVPLCASVVTLALFGYALVADGLDIRVRSRSYTQIDQRRGEAVCWSRLSYFSGLTPSGGLRFPSDVAVLPIEPRGTADSRSQARRRTMIWYDDEYHLPSGWLTSRTRTQLLTVRSRQTQAGLRFIESASGPPRVENRLGSAIKRLLLADSSGTHFRAMNVAEGAEAPLEPADLKAERQALGKVFFDNAPRVPEGLDPQAFADSFGSGYRYSYGTSTSANAPAATLQSSCLERCISRALADTSRFQPVPAPLPPRSYVAVVERSPEVLYGVERVREQASLHVVTGTW
ncbi:MAG: hypothetical protein WD847_17810 [Pirellulales bacterium]